MRRALKLVFMNIMEFKNYKSKYNHIMELQELQK